MVYKFILPSPNPEALRIAQAAAFRAKHEFETDQFQRDINAGIAAAIEDGDVNFDAATEILTLTTQGEAQRMAKRH